MRRTGTNLASKSFWANGRMSEWCEPGFVILWQDERALRAGIPNMTHNSRTNLTRGRDAEERACRHLEQQGMVLAERNYRSPFGEIDLIMQDRATLVFVEVRYRARGNFGSAAETVDSRKQGRLRATAEHYLQNTPRASKKACRFDIVAITGDSDDADFRWLSNVF